MKSGSANTTSGPRFSTTNNNVGPDDMTWASTWEIMNRTLEAFATRNIDSSERGGGKSRKTCKKPKECKDDSDGCIDTWVEVMRLHLEQDNLNDERQACTAIFSNLEGTALNCVVAKKEEERDTADKIFAILLNRFGSSMKGHQAMMRFEKRRQWDDESIVRLLDDLESLRRRSDPEESTNRRNFSIVSKFIDGVTSVDLRTMFWDGAGTVQSWDGAVLGQWSWDSAVLGQWSWDSAVFGQCSLGTVVLGQCSLETVVLGQCGLGTVVLGQCGLGTVVLGQCSLGTVVQSWDSSLGTVQSWDSSLRTVPRSPGTVPSTLGTVPRSPGTVTESLGTV